MRLLLTITPQQVSERSI